MSKQRGQNVVQTPYHREEIPEIKVIVYLLSNQSDDMANDRNLWGKQRRFIRVVFTYEIAIGKKVDSCKR